MKVMYIGFLVGILFFWGCVNDAGRETAPSMETEEGAMESVEYTHTNRLADERSPYLLQHAHNPVDWYAWGDEAFQKARDENKLIFLSIGYSTCHWCHVMERESFEDEEVAKRMNRVFVSIKVDREERPDLDSIYMDISMLMTGRGGWPLNLVLTPEGKPFFAATYIPKKGNTFGTGMMELIPRIESAWKERPEEIKNAAEKVVQALLDRHKEVKTDFQIGQFRGKSADVEKAAFTQLAESFDHKFGGFGNSPKFPQAQNILFLLRVYHRTGNEEALSIAEKTLQNMRAGGIYDHIGFGFHRYSTDREWLVPHFEKMLYDQAMLIIAYTEAYQVSGKGEYRQTAQEIIKYVLRDMTSPEGGFYSAEDADSEGEEGKFYLWDYSDFSVLLGQNRGIYAEYFNVLPEGNYFDEATRRKTGSNILHLGADADIPETEAELESVRQKLFQYREKRIHPRKDDKILTDWNGLMMYALAKAARVFDRQDYYNAAEKAADFILQNMRNPLDGSLVHSYRAGESGIRGMIDDYAFFGRGLLELYRAGFDTGYLREAVNIVDYADSRFRDLENGGYFLSDEKQTDLLLRKKELVDNATPSGNSVMFENLMQLFKITGNIEYRTGAEQILKTASDELQLYPSGFTMLLSGFPFLGEKGKEIVIAGEEEGTRDFIEAVNSGFLPGSVVLVKTPETQDELEKIAPYTASYAVPGKNQVAAYVCTDFTCKAPVFSADELKQILY